MKISNKTGGGKKFLLRFLIAATVLPSTYFFVSWLANAFKVESSSVLKIQSIDYAFEKFYSETLRQNIQEFISKYVFACDNFWNFDQQKLCLDLKSKFKIITSFDCVVNEKSDLVVKIEGQHPFCFINKDKVICETQTLFPIECFDDFDLATLPNINVENFEDKITQGFVEEQFYEFVHKITAFHWQNFEIDYVKPSEIRLYPKNASLRCILLTRDKTFFDCEKINKAVQLCQKVASDAQIQKKLRYSGKKLLRLDLRFKNCIVAVAESEVKGGGV